MGFFMYSNIFSIFIETPGAFVAARQQFLSQHAAITMWSILYNNITRNQFKALKIHNILYQAIVV